MRAIVCGLVLCAAPVSAQVDVDSLQSSLKSGGVEGLSKMLAAMASSGAMKAASDASLHIKKDENGNAMYDFRDIESPTMPPAPKPDPAAQPDPVSAAPVEPPQLPPPDALPKINFGVIEKPVQDVLPKMDFGIIEKPVQDSLPKINVGVIEKPVQHYDQEEARAGVVHLVATKAQVPPMEPEQSHYVEWGGSPKHPQHDAPPLNDAQQDDSEDADEPAALPVAPAQAAQVAQVAGQAAVQAAPGKLADLTRGLESMKSSMDTLLGEANAAMKAQPVATTSSDVLARLDALENENANTRKTMEKQATELLRVKSEQKAEESEIKDLQTENQQLRGKVQAGHKAMLLSTNSEERTQSSNGIQTYFHRKSKRSHRHRN